jgi:NTE family protein
LFQWLDFIAPQFRGAGLLKSEVLLEQLFEAVAARTFADLAIPLRVVTADFWSREEVVLDSGPLRPAIQASMSLPGVFAPVIMGERVLVDGGAVNPVPFDLLPADCTLTVAVDVIGERTHDVGAVPSLSEAVFNTFQIMEKSIIRAKLRHARPDIYLNVDVTDVRVLEFHKAGEVLAQAARLKDDFKRQLELKLKRAEQCDT